jgi:hypothetical protein
MSKELHGKHIRLKICLTLFAVSTIRMVCLFEQLECSPAEASRLHECVNCKLPAVLIDFKQNWNE